MPSKEKQKFGEEKRSVSLAEAAISIMSKKVSSVVSIKGGVRCGVALDEYCWCAVV